MPQGLCPLRRQNYLSKSHKSSRTAKPARELNILPSVLASKTNPMKNIEILDYETHPVGQRQELQQKASGECRWQYSFPFWIDYAIEGQELARPLRCDFADLCDWAISKQLIEDYSIETKEGWVLIPGTSHVEWSPWKEDAVETHVGSYSLTFEQFIREFLTEKDLQEFVTFIVTLKEKSNGRNNDNAA